ncbi:hypothetical protein [Vibrio sp. WXL210]|uniref:hypothetical protein n=1 Tax=Vibrio sp. WXL210 TaxID=3450709 RepID=UPI003EC88442
MITQATIDLMQDTIDDINAKIYSAKHALNEQNIDGVYVVRLASDLSYTGGYLNVMALIGGGHTFNFVSDPQDTPRYTFDTAAEVMDNVGKMDDRQIEKLPLKRALIQFIRTLTDTVDQLQGALDRNTNA